MAGATPMILFRGVQGGCSSLSSSSSLGLPAPNGSLWKRQDVVVSSRHGRDGVFGCRPSLGLGNRYCPFTVGRVNSGRTLSTRRAENVLRSYYLSVQTRRKKEARAVYDVEQNIGARSVSEGGLDECSEFGTVHLELNSECSENHDICKLRRSQNLGHWVTILGRFVLPVVILGVGIFLRTQPSYASGNALGQSIVKAGSRKQILLSAWTGLAAGCLHTLTGPDHLAALAPLCIGRSKFESAQVGALWGCGHDAGQMIFGIVFLALKDKLHLDVIRTWASRVVGFTLITIGGMGVREAQEVSNFAFEGEGGGGVIHGNTMTNEVGIVKRPRAIATFVTGVVHGLQPDALLMVLPALALPSRLAGVAFLGMFLGGTVIAMGGYTLFIASCSEALQKKVPGITKRLTLGSALIAIALGSVFILGEFLGVSLFGG